MRKMIIISIMGLLAASAFALPGMHGRSRDAQALNAQITAILDQYGRQQIGTMTVADMEKIAGEVSIAIQKDAYVRSARTASWFIPGAGQFRTGDTLGGALFLGGDLALVAATVLGVYYTLPANVQFASLDYLNTPLSSIRTTWESNTLADYAPSIGVAIGGMAAQMILRWVSSRHAEADARQAVDSGKVTFQPMLVPMIGPMGPAGRMGMGFGFRW